MWIVLAAHGQAFTLMSVESQNVTQQVSAHDSNPFPQALHKKGSWIYHVLKLKQCYS